MRDPLKWAVVECPYCDMGINSVSHKCGICDGKGFVKIKPLKLKELKEYPPSMEVICTTTV